MKRRLVGIIAIAVLLIAASNAFAFEQKSKAYPWMATFNKAGQVNIYAAVGFYYYGIDVGADLSSSSAISTSPASPWSSASR